MARLPEHDPRITPEAASLLHHMLGMEDHGRKSSWGYRNYFAETKGATRYKAEFDALLDLGFIESSGEVSGAMCSEYDCYYATCAGAKAVGLHLAGIKRAGIKRQRQTTISGAHR